RDAGIEIARKIEIENSAGINAAAGSFEFFDNFHSADFRRAGNGACREAGHQRIETIDVFAQSAAQAGNEMHDVRVALDGHQLFHSHAAIFANAAKVVAAQVHEHDVLGALFFVGEHFAFEALVFGFVLA